MTYRSHSTLFIKRNGEAWALQNTGVDEILGLPTPSEDLVWFEGPNKELDAWRAITTALAREPQVVTRNCKRGLNAIDQKATRAFERAHFAIAIDLVDEGCVELTPMRAGKNDGLIGRRKERVSLQLGASGEAFRDALISVLRKLAASGHP
jgi:hypothetical protein